MRLLVAAGLVWTGPEGLLVHRKARGFGAGSLELPGGKVEPGEAPAQALARELVEEWGPAAARLRVRAIADVLHHIYPPPGPEVVLLVYHVDGSGLPGPGALTPAEGFALEAYARSDLPADEFLAADRDFVRRVIAGEVRLH